MTRLRVACAGILVFAWYALAATICYASLAIFGDSQGDESVQRQVVHAVMEKKPSAVFRVGDLVDDGNSAQQWMAFNNINAELLKTVPYYPALGNHEQHSPLYFENFALLHDQRWYAVEAEGVYFLVLDSNDDMAKDSPQYAWIVAKLQAIPESDRYVVAIMHHPLYSVGMHGNDEKKIGDKLLPLFEKYGVSAVFAGHDHDYQRFFDKGMYFIVTGGGGSELREQAKESPYLQAFKMVYHFCLLSPGKEKMQVTVYDVDLNVIDRFEIPARVMQPAGS